MTQLAVSLAYLKHTLACRFKLRDSSCLLGNGSIKYVSDIQQMLCGCLQDLFNVSFCAFCYTAAAQAL